MRGERAIRFSVMGLLIATLGSAGALLQSAASPTCAWAQADDVRIDVSLDHDVVELGETFEYTLNISTAGSKDIRLLKEPDFRPFSVLGRSQMPQFIIRNGVSERSLTVVYRLRTRRLGEKLEIGPPEISVGEEKRTARSLTVSVVKPGEGPKEAAPRREDDLYVEVELTPQRAPYVGEQLLLEYDLFVDSHKADIQIKPPSDPSLDAFWIEDLSGKSMGSKQMVRMGAKFFEKVLLRRYAIFPLQAGKATIEPMKVPIVKGGFMRATEEFDVASEPLVLDVQPLPPGAPQDFYEGNVGNWDFLVTSDALRTRVGRSVTIRIEARGTGQASRIKLPELPALDGVRSSGSDQRSDHQLKGTRVVGEKSVTYAITPLKEGYLEIPALNFSYFDPDAAEYRTKQSAPIRIEVGAGELPPEPEHREAPSSRGASTRNDIMSALRSELHGTRPIGELASDAPHTPFDRRLPFQLVFGASALLLALLVLFPRARRWYGRDSPAKQRKQALAQALDALSHARAEGDVEAIPRAIKIYCVEGLGLAMGQVTARELPQRLPALGAPESLAAELSEVLAAANKARYAPEGNPTDVEGLCRRAEESLRGIDKSLKKKGVSTDGSAASSLLIFGLMAGALCGAPLPARAEQPPTPEVTRPLPDPATITLEQALQAQEKRDWPLAVHAWRALEARHPRSPELLYNLGTSALQAGDLGVGVLALERALLRDPRDRDAADNLEVARRMVRVHAIERLRGRSQRLAASDDFFWWDMARRVTSGALGVVALLMLWGVIAALWFRPRLRGEVARDLTLILGVAATVGLLLATGAWWARSEIMSETRPAILMTDQATFREGPSEHAASRELSMPLVAGSRFLIEEQREGWLKVRLPDGSSGWVTSDVMGMVE